MFKVGDLVIVKCMKWYEKIDTGDVGTITQIYNDSICLFKLLGYEGPPHSMDTKGEKGYHLTMQMDSLEPVEFIDMPDEEFL